MARYLSLSLSPRVFCPLLGTCTGELHPLCLSKERASSADNTNLPRRSFCSRLGTEKMASFRITRIMYPLSPLPTPFAYPSPLPSPFTWGISSSAASRSSSLRGAGNRDIMLYLWQPPPSSLRSYGVYSGCRTSTAIKYAKVEFE